MSAFAVVNPRSGNGRTGREWKAIERALGAVYPSLAVAFSERRGDVTRKVRRALDEGYEEIVAVGGDGTINEAVNGMFDEDGAVAPDAVFAFVTSGTGGDFRKSFGIDAGAAAAVTRLKKAPVRPIDVGRVSCLTATGAPTSRYFVNIASFGLSGTIVESVNRARIAKLFGGPFAFAFHSAFALLRYRDAPVRLIIDGLEDSRLTISTVAVANGQYFGGRHAGGARRQDERRRVRRGGDGSGAPERIAGQHEADLYRRACAAAACACRARDACRGGAGGRDGRPAGVD